MFLVDGVSLCPWTGCNVLLLRLHTVPCQCHHCMGQIIFSAHVYMSLCVYVDAITQKRTPPLSSHGSCKPIGEYPCNQSDGHYLCHMIISHIKVQQLGQYLDGGQGHSAKSLHMQQTVPSGLVQ